MRLAEVGLDVVARDMDRRRDDVRGRLVAKLDDVFAEIGLDRLDAGGLERLVEADLLGDHRLAFGDALGAARLAEVEEDAGAPPPRRAPNARGRRPRSPCFS